MLGLPPAPRLLFCSIWLVSKVILPSKIKEPLRKIFKFLIKKNKSDVLYLCLIELVPFHHVLQECQVSERNALRKE